MYNKEYLYKNLGLRPRGFRFWRLMSLLLIFLFLFTGSIPAIGIEQQTKKINIIAQSAYLLDASDGRVIYEKNPHKRMYPASTTKILTALIAIEKGNPNDIVTVGKEIKLIKNDASKADLRLGERIYFKDLIRGLMLPSGNDAANTIAVYIGRKVSNNKSLSINNSISKFVYLMNARAKELGANESHFVNPHGYPASKHYTTAHDMAVIADGAMKSSIFRDVVRTGSYKTSKRTNEKAFYVHKWKNTNQLIDKKSKNYYSYATGIKTGYTSKAGHCLVSSATKGKRKVIAVILKSSRKAEWSDAKKLLGLGLK